MTTDAIVISSYARTPMGGMQGALSGVSATQLGATAIKAAIERAGVSPDAVDQVIMGCVLPGALGQAPARQVGLALACHSQPGRQRSTRSVAQA